jgi:hypothetical protein
MAFRLPCEKILLDGLVQIFDAAVSQGEFPKVKFAGRPSKQAAGS